MTKVKSVWLLWSVRNGGKIIVCILTLNHVRRSAMHNMCAHNHNSFKQDRTNPQLVKNSWADITAAGKALVEGVAMPGIGELEGEYIDKDGKVKKV